MYKAEIRKSRIVRFSEHRKKQGLGYNLHASAVQRTSTQMNLRAKHGPLMISEVSEDISGGFCGVL